MKKKQQFPPEKELVIALKSQDPTVLPILYKMYHSAVKNVVSRVVLDEDEAEDLVQDCFISYWQKGWLYNPEKGRLFTWMLNLARNKAIDIYRSKSFKNNRRNIDLDTNHDAVDNTVYLLNNYDTLGLKAMVEQLVPNQSIVIQLFYFEGYTQAEIAEILNMPLGTVKTRIRYALENLRRILKTDIMICNPMKLPA